MTAAPDWVCTADTIPQETDSGLRWDIGVSQAGREQIKNATNLELYLLTVGSLIRVSHARVFIVLISYERP